MNCKPMLAIDYKESLVRYPLWCQPKLNGLRAIYHKGRMITRNQKVWAKDVVRHITDELAGYVPNNIFLDGEMFAHGKSLQEINSAIGIGNLSPDDMTRQIQYHIFDCAFESGAESMTFQKRWLTMVEKLSESANVKFVRPAICKSKAECDKQYEMCRKLGYEGLILRVGNNYYMHDVKSRTLLRRKNYMDAEARVIGIEQGKGRCAETMGSLLCELPNRTQFKIGTGYSDDLRNEIWANRFTPKTVLNKQTKFKFEMLSNDGVPLKPSFIAIL